MKLQQIFINLLSNSMKFTPPNGKVVFDIKQLKRDESHALLRFTVRDTGCGISEKFLPYIFDPFSQEHSGTTSMYGGTGLGLAICKNLVNMMNGTIDVKSKVGVGTEFVVTLKLGTPLHEEPKRKASVDFTKLKVLVIDSDVTTCEHIAHIFTDLGSEASSFSDEDEGIEAIVSPNSFDLILVDWKAVPLDGVKISGIIRKKVSPDVKIALMTSADWISIESEAKIAGIDCIINKPMIKSSLVEAVEEIYGKTNRHSISSMKTDFDFRGKRILLAEDQKLNVEVATRLMEKKNLVVEHAENGLMALQMFKATPTDYYSAILMDIRMPVMDGLQSTMEIRNLKRKDAKKIPIIAMTANAFDEDVHKSLKAGMNAHIAKPINPNLLFQTLYDLIKTKN